MSFDGAAVLNLFSQVTSHALRLGLFDRVGTHEPKNAPGNGLTCAIWVQAIDPIPAVSGLGATAGRVELHVRVYTSMTQEPQDGIDPAILSAVTTLIGEYSGNFTLGGAAIDVDLLGAHGPALSAQAGYLEMDRKLYRVMVVTLPIIIDAMWTQVA